MRTRSYVLVTPAKNEEAYIELTIKSVVAQTILPTRWVIVSDGSTDRTDEIASAYVAKYDFMRLVRVGTGSHRNFGSKVQAIRVGCKQLEGLEYDFFGNLDADVSFEPHYYEKVLDTFRQDPQLGIAGGVILENHRGRFARRFGDSARCVAGAMQLFRRQCYEEIGGFILTQHGIEDAAAEVMARMRGWEVRSFPELAVLHHRRTGTAGTALWRVRLRQGVEDYCLGYHPLFEVGKCLRRTVEEPCIIGSMLRMCGYCWSSLRGETRTVSADFVRYLRREQVSRFMPRFLTYKKAGSTRQERSTVRGRNGYEHKS